MRRATRQQRALAALAAAAVLAIAVGRAPAYESPEPPTPESAQAVEGLRSPFLHERREAVARLEALGPAALPAVRAAFASGGPEIRRPLAEVLERSGSPDALGTLLDALPTADLETAGVIRRALARRAEQATPLLEQRLAAAPAAHRRLLDLRDILRRARVEALFLATKSKSGGTGYYRGQFDALLVEREAAIPICFHILADRRLKMPGEFPVGGYEFLRELPAAVEATDYRVMAGNALAELLRPTDTEAIRDLADLYHEYLAYAEEHYEPDLKDATLEEGLLDTILPVLHRLDPDAWELALHQLAEWYRTMRRAIARDMQAMLYLRVGRYEEAIRLYELVARSGDSTTYSYYNIACAYAIWSREEKRPAIARAHRERALLYLRRAVDNQYLDWPWMEQDRDLDAIRDDPRYKAILAELKRDFLLPGQR